MQRQRTFFQDSASVYVLNECSEDRANAYSHPKNYILFGYHLVQRIIRNYGDVLPVIAILAHEFGHQLQFSYGWIREDADTSRDTELEADGWSGFYLALAYASIPNIDMTSALKQFIEIGDYNFNSPSHHGTPRQRASMFIAGFQTALDWLNTIDQNPNQPVPSIVWVNSRISFYREQVVGSIANNFVFKMPRKTTRKTDSILTPNQLKNVALMRKVLSGESAITEFEWPKNWAQRVRSAGELVLSIPK